MVNQKKKIKEYNSSDTIYKIKKTKEYNCLGCLMGRHLATHLI